MSEPIKVPDISIFSFVKDSGHMLTIDYFIYKSGGYNVNMYVMEREEKRETGRKNNDLLLLFVAYYHGYLYSEGAL